MNETPAWNGEKEPNGEVQAEPAPGEYSPLNKRAAIAVLAVMTHTALIANDARRNIQKLIAGGPYEAGVLNAYDILYLLALIMAAWAVIKWADAAQDNLEALENPATKDRLTAADWLAPGINLIAPLFGMREISKKSNPAYNQATGEGRPDPWITPWGLAWSIHIGVGWIAATTLILLEIYTYHAGAWMYCFAGTAGVIAGILLTKLIVTTSNQQTERHKIVTDPWRPKNAIATTNE